MVVSTIDRLAKLAAIVASFILGWYLHRPLFVREEARDGARVSVEQQNALKKADPTIAPTNKWQQELELDLKSNSFDRISWAIFCWLREDPDGCLSWARGNKRFGGKFLKSALLLYAEIDPRAAINWAKKDPDTKLLLQEPSLYRYLGEARLYNEAYGYIQGLSGYTRRDALEALVSGSPDPRLDYSALASGLSKDDLLIVQTRCAELLAKEDVQRALDWTKALNADQATTRALCDSIIKVWSTSDPDGCVEWLSKLPVSADNDTLRCASIKGVLQSKSVDVPAQLLNITDPVLRYGAAGSAAFQLAKTDRGAALNALFTIQEDVAKILNGRDRMATKFFDDWVLADPDAARKYVEQNTSMPPTLRAVFQQKISATTK